MPGGILLLIGSQLRSLRQRGIKDHGVGPGDEQPRWVAALIPLDLPSGRVGRVLGVAAGPERRSVERGPVIQMQHEHRRIGGGAVDLIERRHPPLGELEFGPATHHAHPLGWWRARGLIPQHSQRIG